jgi:hypothetical protein
MHEVDLWHRTRKGEKMKLIAFNVSDGTVEIHEATCADIKRGDRKRGSHQRSAHWRSDQVEFGKIDWPTKYDFCFDYWNNGILEEHEAENGPGSFDVWQGMDFKPCCNALPHDALVGSGEPIPEPAKRGSNALRKEAREALWSGIENMLNDTVYKSQPELYAMMVAQSERVAYMFGMRDEK